MSRSAHAGLRRVTLALVGILILTMAASLPVLANDFGSDNNWFYNESNFQRYWYASSLNADWKTASNWSRNNNVNPTDMYSETRSAHDNSDVASYVQGLGEGEPPGETECIDASSSTP